MCIYLFFYSGVDALHFGERVGINGLNTIFMKFIHNVV